MLLLFYPHASQPANQPPPCDHPATYLLINEGQVPRPQQVNLPGGTSTGGHKTPAQVQK
jgi:hypothetical protein